MSFQFADYPSPHGVHVQDERGEYPGPPRRNRYSRSSQQTPRIRDAAWISTPDRSVLPTPQTPTQYPWIPPSPSPVNHLPVHGPPSPALTERFIGEHMVVDDVIFPEDPYVDPYQPKRQGGGVRMMQTLLKGLKKLSGFGSQRFPRPGSVSYDSAPAQAAMAIPVIRSQSSSPETEHRASPYNSPYVRPQNLGGTPAVIPGSFRAVSPAPSAGSVAHVTVRSPYVRPPNLGSTPAVIPGSLRVSPVPSQGSVPLITVVSPSPVIATYSRPGSITTSAPIASPAVQELRDLLAAAANEHAVEEGSQTLHDHTHLNVAPRPILVIRPPSTHLPPNVPTFKTVSVSPVDSPAKRSLTSTVARVRQFVAELDELPWVSHEQVADVYVPDDNPRSKLRARIRQGAEPSWYNRRPEVIEGQQGWAEWDMWAKQSAAALMWEGGRSVVRDDLFYADGSGDDHEFGKEDGAFGRVRYPQGGYAPQPVFVNTSGFPPPPVLI